MCDSTLQQVRQVIDDARVVTQDINGLSHQVSLLALDGGAPVVGTWLVVHSGYAIDRVTKADARAATSELRRVTVINLALLDTENDKRK